MKESVKQPVAVLLFTLLFAWLFNSVQTEAMESASSPILERGRLVLDGSAGSVSINREYQFAWETSLRIGVGAGIEIISPAALAVRLVGNNTFGSLYLAAGVVDFHVASGEFLFEPMLMLAGVARFGPQASVRAAVDFSGAENGVERKEHPYWLRGSIGLVLDMGRAATLAFGISYQRLIIDGAYPSGAGPTGWAGDSRISMGSVRTQPTSDLPLLSVHLQEGFDFIVLTRVDVHEDVETTDVRCLAGFSILFQSER